MPAGKNTLPFRAEPWLEYGLPWVQAVFYGVGAAVIGIIAASAYRLTSKSIGKSVLLWLIYLTAAIVTVITESEFVLLFLLAGVVVWLTKAPPGFLRRQVTTPLLILPSLLVSGVAAFQADLLIRIALFFTSLHIAHPLVAITTVILGATIFSLAGFINAMFAKRFDDIAIVPTFVLAPLTYLGGVFYSVNMLGSPWREASLANPILYMVNAFRFGILGIGDVPVWVAYVVMLAFVFALAAVALWLLRKGVGLRS